MKNKLVSHSLSKYTTTSNGEPGERERLCVAVTVWERHHFNGLDWVGGCVGGWVVGWMDGWTGLSLCCSNKSVVHTVCLLGCTSTVAFLGEWQDHHQWVSEVSPSPRKLCSETTGLSDQRSLKVLYSLMKCELKPYSFIILYNFSIVWTISLKKMLVAISEVYHLPV